MLQFENEEKLRDWLVNELRKKIEGDDFKVLDSKNVSDVLICKEGDHPLLLFIEIKLYKLSHSRIGIGNSQGKGFQPEILLKRPIYFDRYLRWLIVHEAGQCVFLNNETVNKYLIRGHITEGQQNNINPNIFEEEESIGLENVAEEIIKWLVNVQKRREDE